MAAMSLLLCLATAILWIVTPHLSRKSLNFYTSAHNWEMDPSTRFLDVRVMGGTLLKNGGFRAPKGQHWNTDWANPTHGLPLGFQYGISPANDPTAAPFFELVAPWYWLVLFTAVLPLTWTGLFFTRRYRRGRALKLHLCPACGYDLRATPDRCPECGALSA
jgi:hypothetical protein